MKYLIDSFYVFVLLKIYLFLIIFLLYFFLSVQDFLWKNETTEVSIIFWCQFPWIHNIT